MDALQLITTSAEETHGVGVCLAECCRGGEVVLLQGELGAGKTTLAQGIAVGLGVTAPVVSPTFIVLREYEGRLPLYHFDFYRLDGAARAVDVEFDEYLSAGGVCVIEWPAHAPALIPSAYLAITLAVSGVESRDLRCEAVGARYARLLDHLRAVHGGASVPP